MKKKIVSLLLVGMYLFGGFGMILSVNAATPAAGTVNTTTIQGIEAASKPASTTTPASSSASTGGPDDMTSTNFMFNPNDLSPSEKKYTAGTKANFSLLLANIGKYLLIATTTIAVLSITVGGLMIATTGPSDRAAKGKTIIMLNIMGVIVALFSYSIIRLVSWLIM